MADKIISVQNPFIRLNIMKRFNDILVEYLKVRPSLDETINRYKIQNRTKESYHCMSWRTIEGIMIQTIKRSMDASVC